MSSKAAVTSHAHIYRKVLWRLMPFVLVLYFITSVDRAAVAYAGPNGMNEELGLTQTAFGLAAGIFFVGYILCEVPSSIILQRVGARLWIMRIMVTWGVIQILTAFVPSAEWLIVARALLGIAEAGFAPGILFYLTLWLPARQRVWAFGIFIATASTATIIGGPLMTLAIEIGDALALPISGWRFMILLTGILPVVLGLLCLKLLPDNARAVRWLTDDEKAAIEADLAAEHAATPGHDAGSIFRGLRSKNTWILGFAYATVPFAGTVLIFFGPTVVAGFNNDFGTVLSPTQVALLLAFPATVGVVAGLAAARSTSRIGHLGAHILVVTLTAAVGAVVVTFNVGPVWTLLGMCLVSVGLGSTGGMLFSIVPKFFAAGAAATAIALVNSICSTGGLVGPYVTGAIIDSTGNSTLAFGLVAMLLAVGGGVMFAMDRKAERLRAEVGARSNDPLTIDALSTETST